MRELKVGDAVYIVQPRGNWHQQPDYILGTVVNITPSGLMDVQHGPMFLVDRFNNLGRQPGKPYHGLYLDDMPIEERKALELKRAAIRRAADVMNRVLRIEERERRFNEQDTKEYLTKVLTEITDDLAVAKQCVEEIP